jgi:hypothetical protein
VPAFACPIKGAPRAIGGEIATWQRRTAESEVVNFRKIILSASARHDMREAGIGDENPGGLTCHGHVPLSALLASSAFVIQPRGQCLQLRRNVDGVGRIDPQNEEVRR